MFLLCFQNLISNGEKVYELEVQSVLSVLHHTYARKRA